MKFRFLASICITFIALSAAAQADSPPKMDAQTERALIAMNNASTWGHPDLFGEFAGMRHFSEGDYKGAMKYFKIGARYADKLSQLSIGLLYENGNGVAKDPVTACAWLAMAAERKYPSFVQTRDRVCLGLTQAQHDQAVAVLDKLMPEYGDAVAKRRMARQLELDKMQITGSHLGYDSGIYQISAKENCGGPIIYEGGVAVPQAGCGAPDYYDPARWEPKKYFAARDAQWRGTVSIGSVEHVHKAAEANAKRNAPAPATSSGSPTHQ